MSSNDVIISVHQPNYIPWIGYFHKIMKSDVFVFLDHVQYSKRSFINRNRVKGPRGAIWLTVPVSAHSGDRIMDVKIDNTKDWKRKHEATLRAFYGKAPYFEEIHPLLEDIYRRDWSYLYELNEHIIKEISRILNIHTGFVESHTLNPGGAKMEMIIDICKKVGGGIYFSGKGGRKYQNTKIFERSGIKLVYQNFEHPVYPQRFGEFIPNLSILDILYNMGMERTKEILKKL